MSTIWIKQPLAIFTGNKSDARGGMVISQGKIVELVPVGQTPTHAVDESFDAQNLVVLPGLINSHHHFYQTVI